MNRPRTNEDRVRSMFDRLGPDRVRAHLKDKRFQQSDERELRKLLFKADLTAAAPRIAGMAIALVGAAASVVSCWKE